MRISMAYKEFTLHMRVFKLIHKGKGKGESSLYHSSGARAVSDKRHIDTPYSCRTTSVASLSPPQYQKMVIHKIK
jgi:hypothetical protein